MGNCVEACGADFDGTIGMVADARHLTRAEVMERLRRLRDEEGSAPEYLLLRGRFPAEFPV
jgi:hypothetical protein